MQGFHKILLKKNLQKAIKAFGRWNGNDIKTGVCSEKSCLTERSKAENMNESEYIRYLLLNQSENPRNRELEVMRLRNEINKIGVNINQIVKNSNFHGVSQQMGR